MKNDAHAAMVAALAPDAEAVSEALNRVFKEPLMADRLALSVILALSHKITEIARERDVSPSSIQAITTVMQQSIEGGGELDPAKVAEGAGISPAPTLGAMTRSIEYALLSMDVDLAQAMRWWDDVKDHLINRLSNRQPGTESRQ